jgi:hypothetical protein
MSKTIDWKKVLFATGGILTAGGLTGIVYLKGKAEKEEERKKLRKRLTHVIEKQVKNLNLGLRIVVEQSSPNTILVLDAKGKGVAEVCMNLFRQGGEWKIVYQVHSLGKARWIFITFERCQTRKMLKRLLVSSKATLQEENM